MLIAETSRLILRHFEPPDAEAMNHVFGDPEVMHFGPGVKTPEWVRRWLADQISNYELHGFGLWAVVRKERGEVIGYAGLTRFPDVAGRPEIELGYRLARAFWGQGYGTEASTAVRDYTFGTLGLTRLISLIDPQNTASIRIALKLGMHHEKDAMLPGYTHPDRVYAMTDLKENSPAG